MKYLAYSALLALCGAGAMAAPQEGGGKAGGGKGGAPPSGGKQQGPPAGFSSSGKGSAAGIPSGTFEALAQFAPLLNGILGQPAKPPSGCAKLEVMFG
jgi:hypothetical protein